MDIWTLIFEAYRRAVQAGLPFDVIHQSSPFARSIVSDIRLAIFGLGSGNALNPRFRRLKRNIQTSEYCSGKISIPRFRRLNIYGFRRLNWFIWNQKGNRLKYAYFRRLKQVVQTSELCSGNLYISRFRHLNHLFQTSETAVFCLFCLFA